MSDRTASGFVLSEELRLAAIVADADTATETLVYFETPEWKALLGWLEFHGVDPRLIPAKTRVSRDACNRCIRYVGLVLDAEGRKQAADIDAPFAWVTAPMIEQGEAPPLPYPDVIARWLR
jgi:hypothetical protein